MRQHMQVVAPQRRLRSGPGRDAPPLARGRSERRSIGILGL